jgi:hypothetical protein
MEHIPPKGKKGKRLSAVLVAIACIGLIGASVLDVPYRLFYQLVAVGVYIFSFELLNRYHLTTYRYTVTEEDFIITKCTGKRVQTVCCLALSTMIGIERQPFIISALFSIDTSIRAQTVFPLLPARRIYLIFFCGLPRAEQSALIRADAESSLGGILGAFFMNFMAL